MTIKYTDGLFYASLKSKTGKVFLGYSPHRQEAMEFCLELLAEKL